MNGAGSHYRYGVDRIWRRGNDVLPCRVYLRHCVLAAQGCVALSLTGALARAADTTFGS